MLLVSAAPGGNMPNYLASRILFTFLDAGTSPFA